MNTSIPTLNSTSKFKPSVCYNPKENVLRPAGPRLLITRGSGENKSIFLYLNTATTSSNTQNEFLENETLGTHIYSDDDAFQCLDKLSQLPPNWDGYHAESPNIDAINHTRLFLKNFLVMFQYFSSPNITANSEGDIVLEWWHNDKKLTLYVSPEQMTYIKVAGERIEDMEDGVLMETQNNNQLIGLFSWLIR